MIPPSPATSFGLMLATFYGTLAHLVLGGDGGRLVAYILASWAGFVIGQAAGEVFGMAIAGIGPIHVGGATFGALAAIVLTRILVLK